MTCFVQPNEQDLNQAKTWTFQIPGDLNHALSFPEDFQIMMEVKMLTVLQQYSNDSYTTPVGELITESLSPTTHGFYLGDSLGGFNLFKSVEVYFKDMSYPVLIDNLNCQSVSWLNKLSVLEHSMIYNPEKRQRKRSLGFRSGFHELVEIPEFTDKPGFNVLRMAIPAWPFRQHAPFSTKKATTNVIPPNLNMCVKLIKESNIPLINYLQVVGCIGLKTKACLNEAGDIALDKIVKVDAQGNIKHYKITKIDWETRSAYLLYNKVTVKGKVPRDYLQLTNGYRVMLSGLNTNTRQSLFLNWDLVKVPKFLILYFLRDCEIQFDKTINTTICPQYSFRPSSLNKLSVEKTGNYGPQELLYVNGLASRDPDPSWYSYLEYLSSHNFCANWEDVFKIPTVIPSEEADRGLFNAFPVDLSDLGKDRLQLNLEFLTPPPPGWTMAAVFAHDVSVKFPLHPTSHQRSFEFSYV